jgi:tRNA (guanine10-N2)-dimethyltransferase
MELLIYTDNTYIDGNQNLSHVEIKKLLSPIKIKKLNNKIIKIETNKTKKIKDIILAKETHQIIKKTNSIEKLYFFLKNNSLKNYYETSYKINISGLEKKSEIINKIATLISSKLNNPKIEIKNPTTEFNILKIENIIYLTKKIKNTNKKFNDRKSHNRQESHPSSNNPKLMSALINILTPNNNSKYILDPFCGAGGTLLEIAKTNKSPIGYDIDKIMLKRAKLNLKNEKIKNFILKVQDATKFNKKITYIITDPPYGKNCKVSEPIQNLYFNYLNHSYKKCKSQIVILPSFSYPVKIIKKTKWKISLHHKVYVHKSMTRHIFLLEK